MDGKNDGNKYQRAPEWSESEVFALIAGVRTHGTNWKIISEDATYASQFHPLRTRMSLKTKWFKMKNVQKFDINSTDVNEFVKKICNVHGSSISPSGQPMVISSVPTETTKPTVVKKSPATKKRKISFSSVDQPPACSLEPEQKPVSPPVKKPSPKTSKPSAPVARERRKKNEEGLSAASRSSRSTKAEESEGSKGEKIASNSKSKVDDASAPVKPLVKRRRRMISFSCVDKIVGHRFVGVSSSIFQFDI
jgi:hypothetical protein